MDNCEKCPPNTFSKGGKFAPCTPCPASMTSPAGSIDVSYCQPDNLCPVGTWVPDFGFDMKEKSGTYYEGDEKENEYHFGYGPSRR